MEWSFEEFENVSFQVYLPTETVDDIGGIVRTQTLDTAVGASGVITASKQALSGSQQEFYARDNIVVDHTIYPSTGTTGASRVGQGYVLKDVATNIRYVILSVSDQSGNSDYVFLARRIN